ncbi:heme exporter protein CcmD [Methyloversatilis thermotolerans]|uniref:heme exporter protein CcmD n=1 Tax=Methyloversatilis thermotolerans TaxID=1346290 RepID=UPI00036EB562|nr:heme exporter protein CcmD [Methyloversatilis thermotolerans]
MNWESARQFWEMGGYGFFVWGSYGVTALLVAAELLLLARRTKQARALATQDAALARIDAERRSGS